MPERKRTVVSRENRLEGAVDVLHLSWSGRVGGIERMLSILLREAEGRSAERHRACFLAGDGPIGDALVRDRLACRLGMRHGAEPRGLLALGRLLREIRPGVLHLHTMALAATAVALRSAPDRVVYTEHFPRIARRPLRHRLLYALLRRRRTSAVALSPGMARAMAACGLPAGRITVVPNPCGVPVRPAAPARDGRPVVGCLTRLVPPARVELAIEIVAELRRRGEECELLVVGDGPARAELERRATELLPGAATFAGEQPDVTPWLDRMDLLLFTREFAVYPLAIVESMARRVPVVALQCGGGAAETVAEAGLLLPDRRTETAAAALRRLFGSPDKRRRLAERGARLAAEHAPDRILDRLDRVYEDLDGSLAATAARLESAR